MREVNLARRRFINIRPVVRLAALLWVLGAIFTLVNFRLYSGHWSGTAKNRQRIVEVDEQIAEQRRRLGELDLELARIHLPRENRRTDFLNALISYRTFPWSALFDDLEEVVPLEVRLLSVQPQVNLVAEPQGARRPRRARSRPRRSSPPPAAAQNAAEPEPEPVTLKRNEVGLNLKGVAKTEDALMEFIDVLYGSPDFRRPFLPGEVNEQGTSSFNLSVVYLTRPLAVSAEEQEGEEPQPVEEAPAEEDASDGTIVADAGDVEPAAVPEDEADSELAAEDEPPRRHLPEIAAAPSDPAPIAAAPPAVDPPPSAAPPAASRRQAPAAGREAAERPITRGGRPAGPVTAPTQRPPTTRPAPGRPDGRGTPPPTAPPQDPNLGESDPPPGGDSFAEPNASATPRLRSGSLPGPRFPANGDFPVSVRNLPREARA